MKRPPNILVYFTDQQRWDTCGCYGKNPMNLTPNLDKMAAGGTRLQYAFTVQPLCTPARACFQTGRYPSRTGVWRNGVALSTTEKTMAHYFKEAGYFTGYIGKWHLANTGEEPVPPGLRGGYEDLWLAADALEFLSHPDDLKLWDKREKLVRQPGYRVDAQTDLVLDFLDKRARHKKQPFFLFNSYLEPHHQNDLNRHVAPEGYAERYKDFYIPPDLQGREGDWPQELPSYYGACASLDENLGRVLDKLAETGLARNTVVFFCSDHGSHFRTRNGEYKRSCHEGSIRVPAVFAGPGFKGGKVVKELVTLLDWPATLLDAAGIPVPANMDGRSILPLLKRNKPPWPQDVFIQISEAQVGRALRTKRWKYGVDAPGLNGYEVESSDVYVEQYLYDLEADPYEHENLAASPKKRAVRKRLAAHLLTRMAQAGEPPARIEPEG
jgi:arylsulfatase A-like enzyme